MSRSAGRHVCGRCSRGSTCSWASRGRRGKGLVKPPPDLPPNSELLAPRSFRHAPCLGFLSKNPCTQGFDEVP